MPSSCLPGKILWCLPILEVGMVRQDCEGFFGPAQVGLPVAQGLHNGREFPFIDVIVSLHG